MADYVGQHTGGGFDVVFDSVGGANMTNSFAAAALNGQIATTVALLDDSRFGLEAVGEAYQRLTSGQAIGKVVAEI